MMIASESLEWAAPLTRPEVAVPLGALLFGILAVLASTWRRIEQHRTDTLLKRDMVARGMSVEEIERLLKATSSQRP